MIPRWGPIKSPRAACCFCMLVRAWMNALGEDWSHREGSRSWIQTLHFLLEKLHPVLVCPTQDCWFLRSALEMAAEHGWAMLGQPCPRCPLVQHPAPGPWARSPQARGPHLSCTMQQLAKPSETPQLNGTTMSGEARVWRPAALSHSRCQFSASLLWFLTHNCSLQTAWEFLTMGKSELANCYCL